MKYLFFALLAIAALNASAQKNYRIVNAFTLNEATDFSITSDSPKATFTKNAGVVTSEHVKKGDKITVSSDGFIDRELTVEQLKKDEEVILLYPDLELRAEYEKKYPFYQSVQDSALYDYKTVDEPAEFPGGLAEMRKYLAKELNYPTEAVECGMSGKVYLQLVVETDGSISKITIMRGLALPMDQECIRVIGKMPKWKPAKKNGKAVCSLFNLPIAFTLH